ncbi:MULTISPECIES: SDR family oxidoreductase [unclassified Mucilaginibacter]|uniref:SDR family oxidoreductase n=1 Tax=unclassified Mucilaginibacter TaxID=2617802 RepID=UPI002AC92935|nr:MULTISPECIES: SDR family oxidoreductase [unclassified Mucilaginibacter]MEB0262361.1 SDR family oxidoreductase [Mucilaginibacter sp. 10I4]MEB0279341.1 SDR family oxidoreductase [Mucilaginibacter sp. 10B2]MEB0302984.1 SDR family oxidoreductase [Mucilaginibacter sp. 5C4]WPX23147.1 SDR family oxidoreductase [Mucilaginibacter sp. 5C4]
MKVLLAGANGYIGTRLIPVLLEKGHTVVCLVRDKRRFHEQNDYSERVTLLTGDLLKEESIETIPLDIDAAYYLVHSMAQADDFAMLEELSAHNFVVALNKTKCRQLIYLSGITNADNLSNHLLSRRHVEDVLRESTAALTVLRAAIIIGSGSSSFEIIRDLTEKLPVMTVPRWVNTKCQPIAIRDVLGYLEGVLMNESSFHKTFDIGGPDVLTFKEMMLTYAKVRKLDRYIVTLPFLSPKISSYWLYFVTSTSYSLAQSLVDSMKNETIMKNHDIDSVVRRDCITYEEALELAFNKIEQNSIVSSWKDALNNGYLTSGFMDQIKVPQNGTLEYKVKQPFNRASAEVLKNIMAIGGNRGWYYWDWIWSIRGFLDKLFGGVGSRRGRTSNVSVSPGDVIDFWRVLLADKTNNRLLLYAEMKLPGEAWLEFKIIERHNQTFLSQVATFRPKGLWGRLYWYMMWPFHLFIFKGMAKRITDFKEGE